MAVMVFDVKVGGDYACFSQPVFKSERVSYPVITPSAARGLLEAIFWKPEIHWQIRQVSILKPIAQLALLRNELESRQSNEPFFIEDRRQQRSSLILADVAYIIRAELLLRPHAGDPPAKYADQFRRRLERGQCHHAPCLGLREFAAWFEPANGDEQPIDLNLDIGQMLFDIAFCESPDRSDMKFYRHGSAGRRLAQGYAQALFFDAHVEKGVLMVPTDLYQDLAALERQDA